jgi:hypothetical protein
MPQTVRERQPIAVGEAPAEGTIWAQVWEHPWIGFVLSATVPGVILSVLGPFGTFGAPLLMRFAYWMPTMALGATIGALVSRGIESLAVLKGRPTTQVAALTLVMSVVMSGVAYGMGWLVFGRDAVRFGPEFVVYVLIISVLTAGLSAIIRARTTRIAIAAAPVGTAVAAAPPPLLARLPAKITTCACTRTKART